MRCDLNGKAIADAEFPGRRQSFCVGQSQFAIRYDSSAAMETGARIRGIEIDLQKKWVYSAGLNAMGADGQRSLPSRRRQA